MAKKEEVVDLKPTSITEEQLKAIQEVVGNINQANMEIGRIESQKHLILHNISGLNDKLKEIQVELEKEYGTVNVNINDGTINYDVEADKKN